MRLRCPAELGRGFPIRSIDDTCFHLVANMSVSFWFPSFRKGIQDIHVYCVLN
ncbi:hypothetical protein CCP3SC1_30008 [Gammaproteobacteria bacterium]